MAVNREKLNELAGDTLSQLARSGELEVTYAHVLSINNLSLMIDRVGKRGAQPAHTPMVDTAE
jgi:hypothetical protein